MGQAVRVRGTYVTCRHLVCAGSQAERGRTTSGRGVTSGADNCRNGCIGACCDAYRAHPPLSVPQVRRLADGAVARRNSCARSFPRSLYYIHLSLNRRVNTSTRYIPVPCLCAAGLSTGRWCSCTEKQPREKPTSAPLPGWALAVYASTPTLAWQVLQWQVSGYIDTYI